MKVNHTSARMIKLVVSTAMTAALLSGCTTSSAPRADLSANHAQQAMASGKHDTAIRHAEAAVLAEPHNAQYRAMLGDAYLDAGRFASASMTFNDAMELGDHSPRTALSRALALTGEGRLPQAAELLNQHEGQIAKADLGLALALAGQPDRAIHIMSNAIRGGENNTKMRQNLAYAYALAGRWREARLMAAQDVPAGEVGDRMSEWAAMVHPGAFQLRVANLLEVPVGVSDSGQPSQLALANNPSIDGLASEAVALAANAQTDYAAPLAAGGELPALNAPSMAMSAPANNVPASYQPASYQPAPAQPASFENAFGSNVSAGESPSQAAPQFINEPAARSAPAPRVAGAAPASRSVRAASPTSPAIATLTGTGGSHLVQLGSFSSEQNARRAWAIYLSRYPELADRQLVITEAVVRGKNYWRVSAGGFASADSRAMCGSVRAGGNGCFAWAEGRPLPGAIASSVRMARR